MCGLSRNPVGANKIPARCNGTPGYRTLRHCYPGQLPPVYIKDRTVIDQIRSRLCHATRVVGEREVRAKIKRHDIHAGIGRSDLAWQGMNEVWWRESIIRTVERTKPDCGHAIGLGAIVVIRRNPARSQIHRLIIVFPEVGWRNESERLTGGDRKDCPEQYHSKTAQ